MTAAYLANGLPYVVMPGLDPGIHSVARMITSTVTEWIAGSNPAMTTVGGCRVQS